MTVFVALYQGATVCDAELVALSADRRLVSDVARRIALDRTPEIRDVLPPDPHHKTSGTKKAPQVRRG